RPGVARQADPVSGADRGHRGVSFDAAAIESNMRKTKHSRREFLVLSGGAVVATVSLQPAQATPATMASAMREITGAGAVRSGRVKLDVPPLVENGNTVP